MEGAGGGGVGGGRGEWGAREDDYLLRGAARACAARGRNSHRQRADGRGGAPSAGGQGRKGSQRGPHAGDKAKGGGDVPVRAAALPLRAVLAGGH